VGEEATDGSSPPPFGQEEIEWPEPTNRGVAEPSLLFQSQDRHVRGCCRRVGVLPCVATLPSQLSARSSHRCLLANRLPSAPEMGSFSGWSGLWWGVNVVVDARLVAYRQLARELVFRADGWHAGV
jgi:hypothetical protein